MYQISLWTHFYLSVVLFAVDASQAGEGTLELVVSTQKSSVRAEVLMRSRGLYDVTFFPEECIPHFLNMTFNEEDVPGSPFTIEVLKGANSLEMENPIPGVVEQVNEINFKASSEAKLSSIITGL